MELYPKHEFRRQRTDYGVIPVVSRHLYRISLIMGHNFPHFHEITGIKHHTTIPYSKTEFGILERANTEVNRHIRNILFDKGDFKN